MITIRPTRGRITAVFSTCAYTRTRRNERGPAPKSILNRSLGYGSYRFVVRDLGHLDDTFRFAAPSGRATFMLRWEEDRAEFKAFRGAATRWDAPAAGGHVFTSGVPGAGNETVDLNLYVFGGSREPKLSNTELAVEKFEYLP